MSKTVATVMKYAALFVLVYLLWSMGEKWWAITALVVAVFL